MSEDDVLGVQIDNVYSVGVDEDGFVAYHEIFSAADIIMNNFDIHIADVKLVWPVDQELVLKLLWVVVVLNWVVLVELQQKVTEFLEPLVCQTIEAIFVTYNNFDI